jgi:hypothetical protein
VLMVITLILVVERLHLRLFYLHYIEL